MANDNIISIQDDINLALTVQEIKEYERLMLETKDLGSTWMYCIADGLSGRYVCTLDDESELRFMGTRFLPDLINERVKLYDLETAQKFCEELNSQLPEETQTQVQFVPVPWRRFVLLHLAALYDVIQKMDAKGKTKRFFASC